MLWHTHPRTSDQSSISRTVSRRCSASPRVFSLSAALRFQHWGGREFVSVSMNWHSRFRCHEPGGAPHKQGHHLQRHQRFSHTYVSSYIDLNIDVWIRSLVSHHLWQLAERCQLDSTSTVHLAVALVCWEFGAVQEELVDISVQLQNKKVKVRHVKPNYEIAFEK